MSIIGPRPALWNQYDLIEKRDKYNVHKLYPGITGYAQIKGRDTLPITDKAKLDGYYFKHISLFVDIKIFILTLISVFRSDGIVEGGTGSLENSK
jgi:O-antigen biosynthesis protein WbqP